MKKYFNLFLVIALCTLFGCARAQINSEIPKPEYLSLKKVLDEKFPEKYKGNLVVDIPVKIACEPMEYLTAIKNHNYSSVNESGDGLFTWESVHSFEITPYEHYHWQPGYTEDEHVPVTENKSK